MVGSVPPSSMHSISSAVMPAHQLDLERHGAPTPAGRYARITQRLLAMTAAIWHNWAAPI